MKSMNSRMAILHSHNLGDNHELLATVCMVRDVLESLVAT